MKKGKRYTELVKLVDRAVAYDPSEAVKLIEQTGKAKFDETVDSELLDFITSKYELYNKLTEDRANTLFKNIWFNETYDRKVRGMI